MNEQGGKNLKKQFIRHLRVRANSRIFPIEFFVSVNCIWSNWSNWDSCSKSCGNGIRTRSRSKTVLEKYGGSCSGQASNSQSCIIKDCPGK